MNARSFIVALVAILLSIDRAPAPIQEIPESPTPAPEQSAKPKPKRTIKPEATSKSSESSTKRQTSSPQRKSQATPNQNPFDGTWVGIFKAIPFYGDVEFTITITGKGSVVTSKSSTFGTLTYQSTCDGMNVKWTDGISNATLTPNSDGMTAVVATDNGGGFFGFGAYSSSVTFRKTSTSTITQQPAPQVVTDTNGPAPVAKPVPDRPGFVYNPFDQNSKILFDVRGKASGTKLVEPKSGRLFTVP